MKPFLVIAGVKKVQIDLSIKKPHLKSATAAFDWLHDLFMSHEYLDLMMAYSLRPPKTWESYKTLEIEGLAEQVILEKASKKLLKRWRTKRPRLLGKRKTNER